METQTLVPTMAMQPQLAAAGGLVLQPQPDIVSALQNKVFALEMEVQRLRAENEQLKKRPAPASDAPAAKKARGGAKENAAPTQQLDDKAIQKLLKNWGSGVKK
jgi:hypothetical protein